MSRFNDRTVEELRTMGIDVEHPAPSLLLLSRADRTRLLVSALSLLAAGGRPPELFEEERLQAGEEMACLGPHDGVLLYGRRLWRPLEGTVCPDSADDLRGALEARPGRRRGDMTVPTLSVLSLPPDAPEPGNPLALWLSKAEDVALRPLGFLGGERRATALRALLCDEQGAPVGGEVIVSAHMVEEGGRVAWRLPLRLQADEGGEA